MKKITAVMLAAFALMSAEAKAVGPSDVSVGAHAGLGVLGDSGGNHFDAGLNTSYAFLSPLTAAIDFSWIDRGGLNINGTQATGSLYLLMGSVMYDTSVLYPGTSAGAAMGIGFDHISLNSSTGSNSNTNDNFYIGPKIAYDYMFATSWSLGGQVDWLITSHANEPNVLEALAVVKWWL